MYKIDWKIESDKAYKRSAIEKSDSTSEGSTPFSMNQNQQQVTLSGTSPNTTTAIGVATDDVSTSIDGSEWLNTGTIVTEVKL